MKKVTNLLSYVCLLVTVIFLCISCNKNNANKEVPVNINSSTLSLSGRATSLYTSEEWELINKVLASDDYDNFKQAYGQSSDWYQFDAIEFSYVDGDIANVLFKSIEKNSSNREVSNYFYRGTLQGKLTKNFAGGIIFDMRQAIFNERQHLVSGFISERLSSMYEISKYLLNSQGELIVQAGENLLVGPPQPSRFSLKSWFGCVADEWTRFHDGCTGGCRLACALSDMVRGSCTLGTALGAAAVCSFK